MGRLGLSHLLLEINMSLIKIFLNLSKWALTIFITLIAIYILSSNFSFLGNCKSFVVQSGSMEPAIMTGDVIVVQKQDKYFINDVVTFNNSNRVVTHRLIEIDDIQKETFFTKGDANRSNDEDKISTSQIFGKVILVIPRLGYLMSFTKTSTGLFILVLVPAAIFVLDELLKIMKNAKQKR